jgi:hypothetical protein
MVTEPSSGKVYSFKIPFYPLRINTLQRTLFNIFQIFWALRLKYVILWRKHFKHLRKSQIMLPTRPWLALLTFLFRYNYYSNIRNFKGIYYHKYIIIIYKCNWNNEIQRNNASGTQDNYKAKLGGYLNRLLRIPNRSRDPHFWYTNPNHMVNPNPKYRFVAQSGLWFRVGVDF